jgi:hypothetical protein
VAREKRRDKALRGGYRRSRSSWDSAVYSTWDWAYPAFHCRPAPCPPLPCPRPFSGLRVIIREACSRLPEPAFWHPAVRRSRRWRC